MFLSGAILVVLSLHSGSDLLGSSEKAFSSVMLNKDCPGTHIHDQKDFWWATSIRKRRNWAFDGVFFLLSGGSHNKNFILSFWPKMKNGWQKRSISQLKGQSLKITSMNQTVVKSTSDTEFPLHWSSHLILGNGGLKKVAQYFITGGH